MASDAQVIVVGGGLAGCECAWQLAEQGFHVVLHEQKPHKRTAAQTSDGLAELVCSNSLRSDNPLNTIGLLHEELRLAGSLILRLADEHRVPAGDALAVDRDLFSAAVEQTVRNHPRIQIVAGEVTALPLDRGVPIVVATGPLTSDALAQQLVTLTGQERLAFFDAIAPIVSDESIDHDQVFAASRWGKGDGDDYLNCPMDKAQYEAFMDALATADQFTSHEFDKVPYFEGCMPVEEMARRGRESLRFGPMKPVGLDDPRTGRRPWAVVQLRKEDRAGRMWNIVGFQTRLRIPEQQRVLKMVPGLENAEFLRFGSIHRNSYVNSPASLTPHLSLRDDPQVLFAGQITGVEGYTESTATGILAAINLDRMLRGLEPVIPPPTTMLGALYRYLREADPKHFQPMNANFGLLEELNPVPRDKGKKREMYAERALSALAAWQATFSGAPIIAL